MHICGGGKILNDTNVYNFFWCFWKLNIKPDELPENIKSILIDERQYIKKCIWDNWNLKQLMDYDFVVWFLDSGYVSEDKNYCFQNYPEYTFSSYERFENFVNSKDNKYEI